MTRLRVRSASSPASHRLDERRTTGVVVLVRLSLVLAFALCSTACIDKPPVGPANATSASLGLVASVAGLAADGDFWVEPIFTTADNGNPIVLPSSPDSIGLSGDVTVKPVIVDLTQCPDGCVVTATLVLHDTIPTDTLAIDTLSLGMVHQGDAVAPQDTLHLVPSFPLTIVGGGTGTGSGTVEVAAIGGQAAVSCVITDGQAADSGCEARYPFHTVVTLVPTAPRGVAFEAWGDDCEGTVSDSRCELVMDGRLTAGARFGLPPTTGDLEVQVAGLPDGTGAQVTVTGPGGFNQTVGATDTLASLPPGDYTISAEPVTVASQNLTYAPDPASQLVRVDAGVHAVAQVSYNPPTTGTLAITITGLPDGVPAQVTAFGQSLGNGQSFSTSGQAPNLEPGEYTVRAVTVTGPDGQPYDPTIDPTQPVEVSAGHVTTVTVTYTAPPATKVVFTTQPRAAASFAPITPPVTVEVRDAQDRLAPGFTGHVTLSLRGGAPGAALRGPLSAIPQRGVATFAGLTVDLAGAGYVLTATAPSLSAAVSDTFSVVPGAVSPDRSSLSVASTSLRTCCDTTSVTVVARDAAGNAIPGATVTLSATGNQNIVVNPSGPTDNTGAAQGRFGSRTIGAKTVSAAINGVAVRAAATVTVQAGVLVSRFVNAGGFFETDIYVISLDGSDSVNLSHDSNGSSEPAWSPDGSKIAFVLEADASYILLMNADGSGAVNVTPGFGAGSVNPAWSPDGKRLAFETSGQIYLINVDGSNPVCITCDSGGFAPSWSPDGQRIAFGREFCRNSEFCTNEIWTMRPDGSDAVPLTTGLSGDKSEPAWSPDGRRIAFVRQSCDTFCVADLYTVNAKDGSDPVNVTQRRFDQIRSEAWSPDGLQLLLDTCVSENCGNLILMGADGANPVRVGDGSDPDWR